MKKHLFTLFIILSSLLMCAAAWLVKNGAFMPKAVRAETQAQVAAAEAWLAPVSGAVVVESYGPVFDEARGQWSLREAATLRGASCAFVRAMRAGRVVESREAGGAWTIRVDHGADMVVSYGGLRGGLEAGRTVARGEWIGQLAGDTLDIALRVEGFPRDPAEILPKDDS